MNLNNRYEKLHIINNFGQNKNIKLIELKGGNIIMKLKVKESQSQKR
jgi:hypothetical protein